MSNVIRSLVVKIGVDLTEMQKGMAKASSNLKKSGKELESAGSALTKGITLPVLAVGTALAGVVMKTGAAASEIQKLSDVTGLSTDRVQELSYVGTKLDVSIDTITGSQSKLIKAMSAAKDGTKAQSDAFKELGINVVDGSGNLRNSNDVFSEAIDRLGRMSNDTERDAISLKLFGRSALEMNPLIKAGSTEIARLSAEAERNGSVMSGSTVKSLDNFNDSLEAMKQQLTAAASKIAMALMPTLEKLLPIIQSKIVPAFEKIAKAIGDVISWFDRLSPKQQSFVLWAAGIALAVGPALTSLGKLSKGLGDVISLMSKLKGIGPISIGGSAAGGSGGLLAGFAALAAELIVAYGALAALSQGILSLNDWMHKIMGTPNYAPTTIFGGKSDTIPKPTQSTTELSIMDDAGSKPRVGVTPTDFVEAQKAKWASMDSYYNNLYKKNQVTIAGMTKEQVDYNQSIADYTKQQEAATAAAKAAEDAAKKAADAASKLETFRNTVKSLVQSLKQATDQFANFTSAFGEVQRTPESSGWLVHNIQGQLKTLQDWSAAMAQIKGKVSAALYSEFLNLGPGAVDQIVALANDSSALADYASAWQQKYDIAGKMGSQAVAAQQKVDQLIESQTNTFNIVSQDPQKAADEVVRRLKLLRAN